MADTIRTTAAGVYVEYSGGDTLQTTAAGVYVEYAGGNTLQTTAAGVYVEYVNAYIRATASGVYVEYAAPIVLPPPTVPPYVLENMCGYAESYQQREAWATLAAGNVYVDRINTAFKRDFRLDFCNVSEDVKGTIDLAFGKVTSDNGTATYTSPLAQSYVVTVHPDAPDLLWSATDSLGTMYWSATMRLREV